MREKEKLKGARRTRKEREETKKKDKKNKGKEIGGREMLYAQQKPRPVTTCA